MSEYSSRPETVTGQWPLDRKQRIVALVAAVAIGGVLAAVAGTDLASPGQVVRLVGLLSFGLVGLATRSEADVEQLIADIERFEAGEDVSFETDRDDEIGRLYEAVGSLASIVRDRETRDDRSERYRQRLYEVTSSPDLSDDEKRERLLELGCEYLNVDNGHVTHIDEGEARHEVEGAWGSDLVEADAVTDLSETFCRKTIESDDILGVADTPAAVDANDPRNEWGIGCYIGAKIETDDGLYGTVCFVDEEPRERPFTASEKSFVDLVARWLGYVTERREREHELERTRHLLEQAQRMTQVAGWELDVTSEPPELTVTDEGYRLQDVQPDRDANFLRALERVHPEDRPRVEDAVDRAIEEGEPFDVELRLTTAEGRHRWNQVIGEPVREDGEVVAVRGSLQDVTERKERELAFESLHETARGLLGIESERDAADLVVETAATVLDADCVALYQLDGASNRLTATAHSAGFADHYGGVPDVGADSDSPLWDCFVTATPTVFDGTTGDGDTPLGGERPSGGLFVPVGTHGVFVVVTTDPPVADDVRQLVGTLVATAAAAFDRIESEATLRDREAELATQNRRLERQIQVTDLIRRIDRSLVEATSREEIEQLVCERLVEAGDATFAWVGGLDAASDDLEPRAWAGAGEEYLDTVTGAAAEGTEPAAAAAATGEVTVVANAADRLHEEPWAELALARDFSSVVAVPLSFDDYSYGVLAVYADEPDAFTERKRAVFGELGENVANSINAVETQRALYADTLVELTLGIDDADTFLARIARKASCDVTYEGLATRGTDETRLFFTAETGDADAVAATLDDLVVVTDYRLVAESESECRFEATVAEETVAAVLVGHGGSPRSIRADVDGLTIVVDLPPTTDVRTFVEMLTGRYRGVILESRRDVERATQARSELVSSLLDELTERQLEVLRTAYFAGFFEWPRDSTGEDVAEMLGVTQPTVNRHLRLGQGKLLAQLFEGGAP